MKILPVLLMLCCCAVANAQEKDYAVASIPPSLVKNAYAVKRSEEISFRIINTSETVLTKKWAITVLNENGENYAVFSEFYDKLQQIKKIEGNLYDASGKKIKELKGKEVMDVSAVDDNNLIDDSRRKVHQFYFKTYPYTVEYEVEIKANNTMFFPAFVPQEGEHFSVQQSSYTAIYPNDYSIRYKSFNYTGHPQSGEEKNKKTLRWEVRHLPAIVRPFASPPWRELTTMIYFAPAAFEVQGYKGNMSTWQEFGKFQFALNEKRDELPENIIEKVKELTAGLHDDASKVKTLYQFLQKNTRYISIQMGIGGWQPFEASFVAQKGYGDCKALTNYMHSLLKAAGIKSNYVLVFAGEGAEQHFMEDFPSRQFNHAILCVPLPKDTIWLECTSSSMQAGYLGAFTGNRKALLIDERGGTVVSTPRYSRKENTLHRKISAKLDADGMLNMKVQAEYGGIQQDDIGMMVNDLSKEKLQKILQQSLELTTYDINDFSYKQKETSLPALTEMLDVTVPAYANVSGKRIFIVPNILNRQGRRLEEDTLRKAAFVFSYAYRDEDDYEIEIPDGYQLESLPPEVNVSSAFGNYHSSVKLVANMIIYHRVMEKFSGRFAATMQAGLVKFYNDIYKADRSKMVLVKKG